MKVRPVNLTEDEAQTLEDVGQELLRKGDRRGVTLLAVYLQYREAGPVTEADFAFMCNVDESAGVMASEAEIQNAERDLAPVVELHGYSKKAVCD